jgi:hypothetical protein
VDIPVSCASSYTVFQRFVQVSFTWPTSELVVKVEGHHDVALLSVGVKSIFTLETFVPFAGLHFTKTYHNELLSSIAISFSLTQNFVQVICSFTDATSQHVKTATTQSHSWL